MESNPGSDSPDRREEKAEEIFIEALELPAGKRAGFIARRCGDDAALKQLVDRLLSGHENRGPFDAIRSAFNRQRKELLSARGETTLPLESTPTQATAREYRTLGRYQVLGELAHGGMGLVLRAYDPLLDRAVAIKVIAQSIQDDPEMLERFAQEARAASALSHPSIITIFDFGQHENYPFIVMEMVEGQSLRDRRKSPFTIDELVRLGTQIADGMAAAHEVGIVHRDLKPGNILLDRRGNARILDFGIASFRARPLHPREAADTKTVPSTVSKTSTGGLMVGTVGYMAPEVIRGDPIDYRADQFAIGVLLYEMATGHSPFSRDSRSETLKATLESQPTPASELRPEIPSSLADIINRCISKRPQARYGNPRELVAALRDLRTNSPNDAPSFRGSLPTPSTSLHGRKDTTRRLQKLVLSEKNRLIVLTGPGGAGKTRLAIETARLVEQTFSGGVIFVALSDLQDSSLVVPMISGVVGETVTIHGETLSDLRRAIAAITRPVLLVLDNFEQVVEAATVIRELVDSCPNLTAIVTSRVRLRLNSEQVVPVDPLPLPPIDRPLTTSEVEAYPAVQLIVARVRALQPDFRLAPDNIDDIVEICRRLDGLPLALELAAARMRMMPPSEMRLRLEQRMQVITGGLRDVPDRQRSLQATMDWSYDLLSETDRTVFRRLAVFPGSFSLEAAEVVVDPFQHLDSGVLAPVESLLDLNLLHPARRHGVAPRFMMLRTIREYALQKMEAEENLGALQKAHAAYYLVLAQDTHHEAHHQTTLWHARIRTEEANFKAALDWMVHNDEGRWGLQLAVALMPFWEHGEHLAEGYGYLGTLLRLPSTQGVFKLRADALHAHAILESTLATPDWKRLRQLNSEAMQIYRQLGEDRRLAMLLSNHAGGLILQKDYTAARQLAEESLELWSRLDDEAGTARARSNYAHVLRVTGHLAEARDCFAQNEEVFERLGDPVSAVWEASRIADIARDQRDPTAEHLYRHALRRFRQLDHPWGEGAMFLELGDLAESEERLARAGQYYREALRLFRLVEHYRGVAGALERLACVEAQQKRDELALTLAAAATALRNSSGGWATNSPSRPQTLASALSQARRRVGEAEGARIWHRGLEMPLNQVVAKLARPEDLAADSVERHE